MELYRDYFQKEIWKDIPDYEGIYQVSSYGNIKSIDRTITQEKNGTTFTREMKGRILKPGILNSGYNVVWLSKNGLVKAFTVHRLLAETFIPNPENKEDVNHIDGNKTNNKISNIEWVTRSENIKHSHKIGGRKEISKPVKCIELNKEFPSIINASCETGINRGSISHVLNGRAKTAGGYTWKYI